MFLLAGLVCIVFSIPCYAQTPQTKSLRITRNPVVRVFNPEFKGKPEEEIESLEHQLSDAIRTKDASLFQKLLSDNVIVAGVIADKNQFIALLKTVNTTYVSVERSEMRIKMFGDTAIATGIQKADIDIENGSRFSQTIFLDTWKKIDSKWQCVAFVN